MANICFYAQFTKSKVGVNSLTITWDIERITRSDGSRSALVTGGANSITVGRRGLYGYLLTGADLTLYDYVATALSSDATLDLQEVPALWTLWSISWHDISTSIMAIAGSIGKLFTDNLNDTISSRLPTTSYTAPDNATITAIDAKTTNLPANPASQTNLDVAVSSRSSHTASDVWAVGTRTLTSFGTLVQDVWSYVTRTLTSAVAGVTVEEIWGYVSRTLTTSQVTSPPGSAITSYLNQEPGKLDITMKKGDDLSFDVNLGVDLTLYDLVAWIDPIMDALDIPIVITNTDLITGKLHFYISDVSVKDLPVVSNKHKWGFKLLTPKADTLPAEQYTRTILFGYFNLV